MFEYTTLAIPCTKQILCFAPLIQKYRPFERCTVVGIFMNAIVPLILMALFASSGGDCVPPTGVCILSCCDVKIICVKKTKKQKTKTNLLRVF